jgi:hypothetical protein
VIVRPQGKEEPERPGPVLAGRIHGSSRPLSAATTVQRRTVSRPPLKR